MKLSHIDRRTNGEIHFLQHEKNFSQRPGNKKILFTIALNTGPDQQVLIDDTSYVFPSQSLLSLFWNQSFEFENAEHIIAWQYNRDFYCIIDHDKEVNCAGFLFFGSFGHLFIRLNETYQQKMEILKKIFIEEFETADSIQTDMLQMLLKRLIIITTRLAKEQYLQDTSSESSKFDLIRQYNVLVEFNFKTQHQVQFYANELHKSPKTLSNLFAQYNHKSPLSIIHERIITEAKRLLFYSEKSAKEIAYELGFEDASHFSRFFKNFTKQNVKDFKRKQTPD